MRVLTVCSSHKRFASKLAIMKKAERKQVENLQLGDTTGNVVRNVSGRHNCIDCIVEHLDQ